MSGWSGLVTAVFTALVLAVFAFAMAVVWAVTDSETASRLGRICGIAVIPVSFGALAFLDAERPLPRAERRRLRAEQSRIAVDREIKRLEREAGL